MSANYTCTRSPIAGTPRNKHCFRDTNVLLSKYPTTRCVCFGDSQACSWLSRCPDTLPPSLISASRLAFRSGSSSCLVLGISISAVPSSPWLRQLASAGGDPCPPPPGVRIVRRSPAPTLTVFLPPRLTVWSPFLRWRKFSYTWRHLRQKSSAAEATKHKMANGTAGKCTIRYQQ